MNEKPLPPKIEQRLADLVGMGEFDQGDVHHCRTSYWSARDDWHKILVDSYDVALARQAGTDARPAPAATAPAPAAPAAAGRARPAPAAPASQRGAHGGIPA